MVENKQTHSGSPRIADTVPPSPPAGPAVAQAQPSTGANAPTRPARKRVFVVDDHPMVRRGLVQTIDNEPDLAVCGQGEDTYAAVRAIGEAKPDVAVVDISLKGGDGIELVKELKRQGLDTPVLILSMHDEMLYAERALRAGARGYIMKQEAPETLVGAIRKVLGGETYVSPTMGGTLLRRIAGGRTREAVTPMARLTDRELEVFRMIGAGQTVKEIADKLCLSAKTVEAHREHIKEKLNLRTSAELLRFAVRNNPEEN
jgi:DNA-binding NarL/FixJ family response regulator